MIDIVKPFHWGRALGYAFMSLLVVVTFVVTLFVVNKAFFSNPPVHVTSLDPKHLGTLCPGQELPINNQVIVDHPVVLFFYVSTMDGAGIRNYNDTQESFPGRPHPHAGVFKQMLPWHVPDLPPGRYTRALAVRGTDGDENPVMILATYDIGGEECVNNE